MANKRMFSKQITSSDAFIDMPPTSQLLYFHLNMEADDDGFVSSPKRIAKMINVGDDDFKILLAKRFLLPFPSGVVVVKHWLLHNAVRKDMYVETQYLDEKKTIQIKDNKSYTELRNEPVTEPLHRLGQDRLDKDRLDTEHSSEDKKFTKNGAELIKSFETINPNCKRMYGNTTQRTACESLIENYTFERVILVIEKTLPKTNGMQYFPTITTPLQLFEKWSALESAIKKYQSEKLSTKSKVAF